MEHITHKSKRGTFALRYVTEAANKYYVILFGNAYVMDINEYD